MKHLFLSFCFAIGMVQVSCAQTSPMEQYNALVSEADALYEAEDYPASAAKFKAAFDQLEGKATPDDRYNAACSYALSGDAEKALYHLFYLAEHPMTKYRDLRQVSLDPDLKSLHETPRWAELLEVVGQNKLEYEKDLDKPLVALLDSIYHKDQDLRFELDDIEKAHGWDSEEVKAHWKRIAHADSLNLIAVRKILDERGWLGAEVIGRKGNQTLFLVIQHADLETQIQYLPMMREAVKAGNANPSSLALLEDRVAMRQGEKQIYGSQIGQDPKDGTHYVMPIREPEKVNERRASVGLGPIEDYISYWDLEWDVEAHKARSAEMENQ